MNYNKLYQRFIESRSKPIGYCERHHIIPKSLGGSDNSNNIIKLTAREHYIAHLILVRIYGSKMRLALWRLVNHPSHRLRVPARVYEKIKLKWREARRQEQKNYFKNNPRQRDRWIKLNLDGNQKAWNDPVKKAQRIKSITDSKVSTEWKSRMKPIYLAAWQRRKATPEYQLERIKRSQSAKLMWLRRKIQSRSRI